MGKARKSYAEMLPEDEEVLVSRIKVGDELAFKELFSTYYSSLCRFVSRLIQSREDVEDIVEDVFEKIWFNREKLDPEQSIKSYLFKSVRNKALNFIRDNHEKVVEREDRDFQVVSWSNPVQDTIDQDLAKAIEEAIEKLPQRCKLIFTLHRQDGLTYSEIADVLGIRVKTVENQIARAVKYLRKSLKDFIG